MQEKMCGMIHILLIPSEVDSVCVLISFCIINLYNKSSLQKKCVYQPIYRFQNVWLPKIDIGSEIVFSI